MNPISRTQRLVSLSLAVIVTVALGQSLDRLAAREPGSVVMARAGGLAAVTAPSASHVRGWVVDKRG